MTGRRIGRDAGSRFGSLGPGRAGKAF
jgi:hypothetical protein